MKKFWLRIYFVGCVKRISDPKIELKITNTLKYRIQALINFLLDGICNQNRTCFSLFWRLIFFCLLIRKTPAMGVASELLKALDGNKCKRKKNPEKNPGLLSVPLKFIFCFLVWWSFHFFGFLHNIKNFCFYEYLRFLHFEVRWVPQWKFKLDEFRTEKRFSASHDDLSCYFIV